MIPAIPFRITTTIRQSKGLRQENRNARTLQEAHLVALREQHKPHTSKVELWLCIEERGSEYEPDTRRERV